MRRWAWGILAVMVVAVVLGLAASSYFARRTSGSSAVNSATRVEPGAKPGSPSSSESSFNNEGDERPNGDTPIEALKKDLPADAAEVLERFALCIHFGGEERYDEERSNYIDKQVDELHCATVIDDRDAILKKYESDPKVKAAFDEAEQSF